MIDKNNDHKTRDTKKELNNYMMYAGLGFQIGGSIALGVLLGWLLDRHFKTSQPYFTLAFSFVFLIAGMYLAFKDLVKKK